MLKTTLKLLLSAIVIAMGNAANAAPLHSDGPFIRFATAQRRLAHSPLPSQMWGAQFLMPVRELRHAGGGGSCWTHCYATFDECMGLNAKEVCVARVKLCMETCDRLAGMTNPTQR